MYPPAAVLESELERFYILGIFDIGNVKLADLDSLSRPSVPAWAWKGFASAVQCSALGADGAAQRSVSYTFVYQTAASSQAHARTRAFNHCLRELGIAPSRPGIHRGADTAKALAMRAALPVQLGARLVHKLHARNS